MRGLVLAIAVLAGCYKPSAEDCSYRCMDGVCPVGLTCDNNQLCRVPGNQGMPCGGFTDDSGGLCGADEMVCSIGCTNVATDPDNCGLCGRKCGGQVLCEEGRCAVETIRTGLYAPGVLAGGAGYVLYGEGKFAACSGTTSKLTLIRSAAVDTKMFDVPIAGDACPGNAAIGNGSFYVTGDGYVRRYLLTGTGIAEKTIATGAWASGVYVAATAGFVYYGTHEPSTSVHAAPLDLGVTGNVVKMVSPKVQDLVRTQSQIWFETSLDAISTRQIDVVNADGTGHMPGVITTELNTSLAYTALPAPGYLFIGESGTPGRLLQIQDGIRDATELKRSAGIIDVQADEIAVYWAERTAAGDASIYMRRHGSQLDEPIALEQPLIREIALDPPYLYWNTDVDDTSGALYRAVVR